jgi:chemotaxis methyl-accepting protein methylase
LYWRGTHAKSIEQRLLKAVMEARGPATGLSPAGEGSQPEGQCTDTSLVPPVPSWETFDAFLRRLFAAHHFSWQGFRRKRRSLLRRFLRRIAELGLHCLEEYELYLQTHPDEAARLHEILCVTVSRFFRDREEWWGLWQRLSELKRAATGGETGMISAWSVACASGEEPYTLCILWRTFCEEGGVDLPIRTVATDISAPCLKRAAAGLYPEGALRSMPPALRERFFRKLEGRNYELDADVRNAVEFKQIDHLREPWPTMTQAGFDLILCRNFAFTYLDEPLRSSFGRRLVDALRPGGLFMVGSNDRLGGDRFDGTILGLERIGGCLWRLTVEDIRSAPGPDFGSSPRM